MDPSIRHYRTLRPPKEHEEAIRMLLEGIGADKQQEDALEKGMKSNESSNGNYDYEEKRSTNSFELSSTSDGASLARVVAPHLWTNQTGRMKSKATSTTTDSVSSYSNEEKSAKEPIPSRTIAVQCDLKSSSAFKRDTGSMQASSISSTRYGFYNFSQDTLGNRRKLQRSISSRNIASPQTLPRHKSHGQLNTCQVEAPTSMSELSASSSSSSRSLSDEDETEIRRLAHSELFHGHRSTCDAGGEFVTRGFEEKRRGENKLAASLSRKQGRRALNDDDDHTSVDDRAKARARIDTLSRRPVTALSYVSSSKLRDSRQQSASDGSDNGGKRLIKSRAMSQMALSTRPRTPQKTMELHNSAGSSSDSEVSSLRSLSSDQSQCDDLRIPQSEEMVLNRGQTIPIKPPRPTLISSYHNEQVRDVEVKDLKDHEAGKVVGTKAEFRANTLEARNNRVPMHKSNKLYQQESCRRQPVQVSSVRTSRQEVVDDDCYDRDYGHKKSASIRRPSSQLLNCPDERNHRESSYPIRQVDGRINSMSLSRRQKPTMQDSTLPNNLHRVPADETNLYNTSARPKPPRLTRSDRTKSQTLLTRSPLQIMNDERRRANNSNADVSRSTSMRQINREPTNYYPHVARETRGSRYDSRDGVTDFTRLNGSMDLHSANLQQGGIISDDSESPLTKTWANPSNKLKTNILGTRQSSHSIHDVNNEPLEDGRNYPYDSYYTTNKNIHSNNNNMSYNSSSEESSSVENVRHFIRSHPLDHDSQTRLNESGLPATNLLASSSVRRKGPSSYLGFSSIRKDVLPIQTTQTMNRNQAIRGRAMSQQSLTRPTMPLGRRRGGGSHSGSDVGGSSMSLVSRLNGRFENAYTRSPVVMYIPQAAPKPLTSSMDGINGRGGVKTGGLLRKSSRSKQSLQEKSRRNSSSRNGSDNESSSMLRTLVKPKPKAQGNYSGSRRGLRGQNMLDCDGYGYGEDMDGIGQLATEVDSYKFRRRYSVPKDAKINWFAKLKQRVSSTSK